MLNSDIITEINKVFHESPGGFLVVDSGRPSFAVLPYRVYQSMKQARQVQKEIKKVLVTGGAGYIGSHTVKVLQDQGYEVVVFDNLSTGRRTAVKNCKFIEGDLANRDMLNQIFRMEKFDAVMHFAASSQVEESVKNPAKYYQNNVVNSLNLAEAMVASGVRNLVFSSSAAVYGNSDLGAIKEDHKCQPTNPYGETKLAFENILRSYAAAYELSAVSLRYFNAAGAWPEQDLGYNTAIPFSHLIPRVLDVALGKTSELEVYGNDYDTPDGTCVRDYVHVLDLAEAHMTALQKLEKENGFFVYNVGTETGCSVLEVIEIAMEVTGRMIPMKVAERRAGDPAKLVADSGLLQSETGWKPKFTLPEILKSSWEWHRKVVSL